MDENDLKGLVARAVAEHEGPLLRYACSLCRDTEMARDAVQDTFIKLWQEGSRQVPERLAP
jgi:DNA-directed RNA polymerase specialized sigma24 family protein